MGVRGGSALALLLLALPGHSGRMGGSGSRCHPRGPAGGPMGGMGLSHLSSLLSLEFLREPVGAGEGLLPTEARLGVTQGVTPAR